jgi:hypothetical protein
MEFGLLHEFQKSQDTSEAGVFALVDAAEQWGSTPCGHWRSVIPAHPV